MRYRQAAVNRPVAGSIPATAALTNTEGQANWRWQPSRKQSSDVPGLEGSTPSPSALMCPWPSGKGASLPSWRGGFDSRRALFGTTIGDRLTVGRLALNQVDGGSSPSPRTCTGTLSRRTTDPGQLLLVVTPGSEPGGRWFDSNPRNFAIDTEVIRPDEEPVLKTGGGRAACGFESHGFRFLGLMVQQAKAAPLTLEIVVRLQPGLTPKIARSANRQDARPKPRLARFNSAPGPLALGRQPADHLGLEPRMLWVRPPPEPLTNQLCPCGAAWSARRPVTAEIVGSNPIGDAGEWRGTQIGKAAKLKPW